MRTSAAIGVLVLAGCNQIFGLDKTSVGDGGVDPGEGLGLSDVKLTWILAEVNPDSTPMPVAYPSVVPGPAIRFGTLDEPFREATYINGSIPIPDAFLSTPWRLEYPVAGDVMHEVQWMPGRDRGHLVVPSFGRLDRTAPPSGTGYQLDTDISQHTKSRVFSTGLWMVESLGDKTEPLVFQLSAASAASQSGEKGNLDAARGDRVVLLDYASAGNCKRNSTGFAVFEPTPLTTGQPILTSTWTPIASTPLLVTYVDVPGPGRFAQVLGAGRYNAAWPPDDDTLVLGYVPIEGMPAFTTNKAGSDGLQLPAPVMLDLATCTHGTLSARVATPAQAFRLAAHGQVVNARQAAGVTLHSGFETLDLSGAQSFEVSYPVALAIAPIMLGPLELADGDDTRSLPGTGHVDLSFAIESGAGLAADYFEVTLYRIDPELTPERVYTVVDGKVRIELDPLMDNKSYVFAIRSYRGNNGARDGDFSKFEPTQTSGTVFTNVFKIVP